MALLPVNISFTEWANQLNNEYSTQDIPRAPDEKDWKSWSEATMLVPAFVGYHIPSPYGFDNWREWASQFLLSVGS